MFNRFGFKFFTLAIVITIVLQVSLFAKEGVFYLYTPDRVDNKTASGQIFDQNALTCAHSSLNFGTRIYVSYNGNLAEFRVNDRIKAAEDVFAVSPAVLKKIGAYEQGALTLSYSIVEQGDGVDEWNNSTSDTKWFELHGISSDNLFDIHSSLLALGIKSIYDSKTSELILPFVNKNDFSRVTDILEKLSVDTDKLEHVQLERNPLRQ